MDANELRAAGAAEEAVSDQPTTAFTPARAEAMLDVDRIACRVRSWGVETDAGLHPATGGPSKDAHFQIINNSRSSISTPSAQSKSLRISRWSPIERARRRTRLRPPAAHNEQSFCRDIVSLWTWWRLPGVSALALPLCGSRWQVGLPMTSIQKAVQNGQHSFPNSLHLGQRNPMQRSMQPNRCAKSERQQQDHLYRRPSVGRSGGHEDGS